METSFSRPIPAFLARPALLLLLSNSPSHNSGRYSPPSISLPSSPCATSVVHAIVREIEFSTYGILPARLVHPRPLGARGSQGEERGREEEGGTTTMTAPSVNFREREWSDGARQMWI